MLQQPLGVNIGLIVDELEPDVGERNRQDG